MLLARTAILALCLGASGLALADDKSKACAGPRDCPAPLACVVTGGDKKRCERVCTANADCPQDHRCVKDGRAKVCRAIVDGVDL